LILDKQALRARIRTIKASLPFEVDIKRYGEDEEAIKLLLAKVTKRKHELKHEKKLLLVRKTHWSLDKEQTSRLQLIEEQLTGTTRVMSACHKKLFKIKFLKQT